jgi:predicted N-acetyltransferase YhbS
LFSAVLQDQVVGHAELTAIDHVHGTTVLRRVIVDPRLRRQAVGSTMVQWILRGVR